MIFNRGQEVAFTRMVAYMRPGSWQGRKPLKGAVGMVTSVHGTGVDTWYDLRMRASGKMRRDVPAKVNGRVLLKAVK